MKKITVFGLAMLLFCSISLTAYADDISEMPAEDTQTVSGDTSTEEKPADEEPGTENAPETQESDSDIPDAEPEEASEEAEPNVRYVFEGEDPAAVSDNNTVIIPVKDVEFIDGDIKERKSLSFDFTDPFDLATADTPVPSLEDGTWHDYGLYYDYNYDTSSAAQWGAWGGNARLTGQTYPDTNNNDISNAFGLYTDGENVKLYISYAGLFYAAGNGNDYNFMFNGSGYNGRESAKFRVTLEDGTELSSAQLEPGEYNLKVYHGDHAMSGYVADAYGTILVKPNNAYNEMEITIPISTMKEQNGDINTEVIQNIAFTTPNLMRGRVECAGTSTGAGGGAALALLMSAMGMLAGAGKFGLKGFTV